MQPDRDCYQSRNADAELFRRLSEGEYCHVLAQRQTGKTSLAASTAKKLRSRDVLVALVDLTQASGEDPSENAGRWYYSIAYRIVRDLRIRSDIQSWWKERGGLTNLQRMREFFLEVVLQETSSPVVVFFDRIDMARGEPLALDLFETVRACFDARATDPSFQRLSFAMLGSVAPTEIVKNIQGSAFEVSVGISLPDFSAQEMAGLMAGLGEPLPEAQMVLSRVWTWTRGHPYLSQKVFRGLARRRDDELTVETVDELVQTQFIAANSLREEPHLSAIAERLALDGSGRTARLNLYGRIRKGVDVSYDSASVVQQELLTSGVVAIGDDGQLRVRNEIYSMVFSTRWVNQNLPYGFRSIGVAAAIVAFVLAIPIWYTEYLPRPYVRALSSANQDYQVAKDAYANLHMLPGYAATADRLFEDFLARKSLNAESLPEMMQVYRQIAEISDGEDRGEELLADFWERRASSFTHEGARDEALIALLEAMQQPTEARRSMAAELIGTDYRNLTGTLHSQAPLKAIEGDAASGLLTVLDGRNNIDVWRLDGASPGLLRSDRLIAEERLELEERLTVPALGDIPRLLLKTSHSRPEQVDLILRAPSGQQARLNLAEGKSLQGGLVAFDFTLYPDLKNLLNAELVGNWTLALSDMEQGVTGSLLGWGLFPRGATELQSTDFVSQPIPEPRASENATAALGPGGQLAMSWPADPSTLGPILVWDVGSDNVVSRIPRGSDFIGAQFVLGGTRVITLEPTQMTVWETDTGSRLGTISLSAIATELPVLSGNGRYAAISTVTRGGGSGIAVWDLQSIRMLGTPVPTENAVAVAIDSGGKYLAIGGIDPWARVWSLRDGSLVREFEHASPLRALLFDPSGNWLATDDLSNTFHLWDVESGGLPVIKRLGSSSWRADFSADSSRLLFGSSDRAYEVVSLPSARTTGLRLHHGMVDSSVITDAGAPHPILLASRNLVITNDGGNSVKVWSVPGAQQPVAARTKSLPTGAQAALSSDGKRIAIGTLSGDVRIYAVGAPGDVLLGSTANAEEIPGRAAVVSLKFSADRQLLASALVDGRIQVWEAATGVKRDILIVHPDGAAHDLEFVDSNRYLVSTSRREVLVTDVANGDVVARLRIQADDPHLAVASEINTIFIADDLDGVTAWNWTSGQSDRIVEGQYQVRQVAVTPDGSKLVTAGAERDLIIWDVFTREPLEQADRAAAKVDDMWIVADGSKLLVQAGPWLQSLAMFPNGMSPLQTRVLNVSPAAVQPGADGESAFVLSASPSRPVVAEQSVIQPSAAPLEGDPEVLMQYWRERLSMAIDEKGDVRPLSENAEN